MKWLNDARTRSVLAGAAGGLIGWMIAEALLGTPKGFAATLGFGLFAGLGIGALLGVAEGLVIGNTSLAMRGALIGLAIGAGGGMVGAGFGQIGYQVTSGATDSETSGGTGSVFSAELRQRLEEAGAKSGEIEIGLIWQNENDLDLHVVDPNRERIFFQHRLAASGGELDVDRNAGCEQDITNKPVEHVVWPVDSAPFGEYEIFVHHYANCGAKDPTSFQVELLVDGKRQSFSGSTSADEDAQLVHSFTRNSAVAESPSVSIGFGPIIARILGWMMFGALVGIAEGFRRRSSTAARNAAIGGAIGGAMGGLVFEIISRVILPMGFSDTFPRFLGLVILGACIGLWIVLIERALSAVLSVRSGRQEGREIFLDKSEMRIGRNEVLEIYLGGDQEVHSHHATVRQEGARHVLVAEGGGVTVNGSSVSRHALQNGDTLVIGKTRLAYKHKAAPAGGSSATPSATPPSAARRRGPPPPPPPPKRRPQPKP